MECEREVSEVSVPVSPSGQYLNSSVLSLSILAVLESEIPIDDSQTMSLLKNVFLPINPRFSSIMVEGKKRVKKWKRVEVKLEDHINVPRFPEGMSLEFYDKNFNDYLSKISLDQFPHNQPLWEIHIIKYPTSNAAGNVIFKLHHALGDGFSLMGALLSCLQRADNPAIPLTFPSRQSNSKKECKTTSIFKCVPKIFTRVINTVQDFGWSYMKSRFVEDDRSPIRSGEGGFRATTITTLTFSLDCIKQIKAKLKVTINDVITGIIFLGTRLYMEETSHESGKASSTALVLFNTRAIGGYKSISEMVKPNAEMPWGNRFTFLQVPIPKLANAGDAADESSSNPLRFVMKAHHLIKRKRNSAAVYLIGTMLDTLRKLRGPEATARYLHSTLKNSSLGISNLIGPVEPMTLANYPVRGLYFTVNGGPEDLSITVVSYVEKLRVAVRMDKSFIDPQKFNSSIEKAFDMIFRAAVESTSPAISSTKVSNKNK
ncbi:hypothetical protein CsSME_00019712 [Camellia sinensis var. sinensis]